MSAGPQKNNTGTAANFTFTAWFCDNIYSLRRFTHGVEVIRRSKSSSENVFSEECNSNNLISDSDQLDKEVAGEQL